MRHRVGVGRVNIHKVRGINSPIKYSACLLSFCLSGAPIKAEIEVLLELTNLTLFLGNIGGTFLAIILYRYNS